MGHVHVLGTDIFSENIAAAREKFGENDHLSFAVMDKNGSIPRLKGKPYHLMFCAFVLDTIPLWSDLVSLCQNMVGALTPHGELYLLRLHPNAFAGSDLFAEYHLKPNETPQHGDSFTVELRNDRSSISFLDTFWSPQHLGDLFTHMDCTVSSIEIRVRQVPDDNSEALQEILRNAGVVLEGREWQVPLFQILRIIKSD